MKLRKNGRKTQKAIRKALMLGLPVAGLLAMAGCRKESTPAEESRPISEKSCVAAQHTIGKISWSPADEARAKAEEARAKAEEARQKAEEEARRKVDSGDK